MAQPDAESRQAVVATNVSLAANVLLLSVDPARKGLLAASRGRLRDAVEVARAIDEAEGQAMPPSRGSAIGAARRELLDGGLIVASGRRLRNIRLVDWRVAAVQFRALLHAIEHGAAGERDVNLLLLLATSGALARRLPTYERGMVARRLRAVAPAAAERGAHTAGSVERRAPRAVVLLERQGLDLAEVLATFELRDAGGTLKGFDAYGHHEGGSPTKWMQ